MPFLSSSCHILKCAKSIWNRILDSPVGAPIFLIFALLVRAENGVGQAKKTFVTIQWQFSSPLVFSESWCFFTLCVFSTAKACVSIGVLVPQQSPLSWVFLPLVFSCCSFFHAFYHKRPLRMRYSLIFQASTLITAIWTLDLKPPTTMDPPREAPFLVIWLE